MQEDSKSVEKIEYGKDTISNSGFSPSTTRSLLRHLKALKEKDRIFKGGQRNAEENEKTGQDYKLTRIASTVMTFLNGQLQQPAIPMKPSEVDEVIEHAEEFLSIFPEVK